jgi:hypothetical protein
MSYEDNVKILVTLRNFSSDSEYLNLGDFWIEKLSQDDKIKLREGLTYSNFVFHDHYILGKHYYIGRGKSGSVLTDNARLFIVPFFRALKLFRTGDVILPFLYYFWRDSWREMPLHGDNHGAGYGLKGNPHILNKDDIEVFNAFRKELKEYLKDFDFVSMPYRKNESIKHLDLRCVFAMHLLLKGSVVSNNPFLIMDKLVDYTMGLESLYLDRRDDKIRSTLSSRITAILSQDEKEKKQISRIVKRF